MSALIEVLIPVLAALFGVWIAYLIGIHSGERRGAENERRLQRMRERAAVHFDAFVTENRIEP